MQNFKYDCYIGDTLKRMKKRLSKGDLEVIRKWVLKSDKDLEPGFIVDEIHSKTWNATRRIGLVDIIRAIGCKQHYDGSDIQASMLHKIISGWNLKDDRIPAQDPKKLDEIIFYLEQ